MAGGVALAIMMIPTITRTTEEMLLLVPNAVREAAYGLGVSRWRTTLSITLRTATSGVITGVMLAFARVAGETAPLLFTAFGNNFGTGKSINRLRRCLCKFSYLRQFRRMMNGIGRPGRER